METKGFFIFNDEKEYFDELSFEERGKVITAIFEFCNEAEISVSLEGEAKMLFTVIKRRLLSDRAKYAEVCKKRAESAKKKSNAKSKKNEQNEQMVANAANNKTKTKTETKTETETESKTKTETETEKRDIISCTPSEYSIPPLAGADPVVHSCGDERRHTSEETAVVKSSRKRGGGDKKYDAEIGQIIDYLNQKTGTKYKASTQATRRLIEARLKEGFTVEQFKSVIDKKVSDWSRDEKMAQYLRPETLFGSKFDSYLNAPTPVQRFCEHEEEFDWGGIF